jgi:hypothetical protein
MVTTGVGTDTFTWGTGLQSPPSSVRYKNTPFAADFEDSFKIGDLTYFNGTIDGNSGADKVSLSLEVNFTLPSGLNQSFIYGMDLINTPNTGSQNDNADYLVLSHFPSTVFSIGSDVYTLTLDFDNLTGGGFLQTGNQLHVLEGNYATADHKGKVTKDISGVPDVASTLPLLALALSGMAWLRRKLS